jgi:hypothetical protein
MNVTIKNLEKNPTVPEGDKGLNRYGPAMLYIA